MNEQVIIMLLGAGLVFVASRARRWRLSNVVAAGREREVERLSPALEAEGR